MFDGSGTGWIMVLKKRWLIISFIAVVSVLLLSYYFQILSITILVAHWAIIIGLSMRVIARRLPVGVSLAWLAITFSVPFVGAAVYLIFGDRRLDRPRIARQSAAKPVYESALATMRDSMATGHPNPDSPGISLYRQALNLLGVPALKGNRMILLRDYAAVFDALVQDIDGALKSCRLAFYILFEGGRTDDVVKALIRACGRGVSCRLLVDAMGSKRFLGGKTVHALRKAGVEVIGALPTSFGRRADLRYHRKILIIDDNVGYTGSQNLVDPRFFKQSAGVGAWVDAVVRVEGPATAQLANIFEMDWRMEVGTPSVTLLPRPDEIMGQADAGAMAQVIPSGPDPDSDALHQLLLTAIYSSRESLTLTTPYFVPDDAVLTAICSAAQSGVSVTLIVPQKNDSFLVRYAGTAHFDDLLKAGVRIAQFRNGLLHTKSMVVDGALCLFGSVNLDMRSFWLDFEDSLFVYGKAFAAMIFDLQQEYLSQSDYLDPDKWRQRSTRRRFLENTIRLLSPLL